MSPQSLLVIFTNPPQVRLQDVLLEDYVASEIDEIRVFASVPPWNPMHDLLVDRETQTLAGIVYPVVEREQAAIATICRSLPTQVVRYCISPVSAAGLLRSMQIHLTSSLGAIGDPNVAVNQFPESLRPHRQLLRNVLAGEIEPEIFPTELRAVAAKYFEENAAHSGKWANDAVNFDRVEVTWVNKPMDARLPDYFPSDLGIELAQYFAEDVWFYREDDQRIYAVGVNYLDKTLSSYGLQLPNDFF